MFNISADSLMNCASVCFDAALHGIPGFGTAEEMARDYGRNSETVEEAIDSLVRWQMLKTGSVGFVTGLGGIVTLPVALPADLSSLFFHQMRMVAATAYLCGQDPRESDRMKTLCLGCLAGNALYGCLRDAGLELGQKAALIALKSLPGSVVKSINSAVGMRLVTKFGTTGVINLGRALPFAGGLLGGAADAVFTRQVGMTAKNVFLERKTA